MWCTKSKEDKVTTPNQNDIGRTTVKQNGSSPATTANKTHVDETTAERNVFHDANRNRTLSISDLINNPPSTISEYCKPLLIVNFFGQTSDEEDEVYNFKNNF